MELYLYSPYMASWREEEQLYFSRFLVLADIHLPFFGLIAVFSHLCISSLTFLLKAVTTKTVFWDMSIDNVFHHQGTLHVP